MMRESRRLGLRRTAGEFVSTCVYTLDCSHMLASFDERITTECLQYFEKQNRGLTVAAHAVQQVTESIRQIESDRQGF